MHAKPAVLNALLVSLLVDIHDVILQAEEWSSRSRTIVVNMSVKAKDRPSGEGYRGQMPL